MRLLTSGPLHLTCIHVETTLTVDDLAPELQASVYTGPPPTRGWGGVDFWREDEDGTSRRLRDRPGEPALFEIAEQRVLLAKLIFDQENSSLRRRLATLDWDGYPAETRYFAEAVDVAVIEADSLFVIVASHDEGDIARVMSALKVAAGDGENWVETRQLTTLVPPRDLFLWLLKRENSDPKLAADLTLSDIRAIRTESPTGKLMSAARGVDVNRLEVAAAIAAGHDIGPAKLALYDSSLGLSADIFYLLDGSFDIHRGGSYYDGDPVPAGLFGVRASIDVATTLLPKLVSSYRGDKKWNNAARAAFRAECSTYVASQCK